MEMWGVSGVYHSLNNEKMDKKRKTHPTKQSKPNLGWKRWKWSITNLHSVGSFTRGQAEGSNRTYQGTF